MRCLQEGGTLNLLAGRVRRSFNSSFPPDCGLCCHRHCRDQVRVECKKKPETKGDPSPPGAPVPATPLPPASCGKTQGTVVPGEGPRGWGSLLGSWGPSCQSESQLFLPSNHQQAQRKVSPIHCPQIWSLVATSAMLGPRRSPPTLPGGQRW